jgi:hypothetical protein
MRPEDDHRQPEEIERDIERTREEVSSTIDAIQRKLTPGQMMDQALSYARTSLPADFGSNLGSAVRENPVPVTLIGVGIAWLMMAGQGGRQEAAYRRGYAQSMSPLNRSTSAAYDASFDAGSAEYVGADGQEEGKLHRTMSKVGDAGRDMKHRISEGGQHMRERAHSVRGRASELGHRSQETYYRAKDSFGHMLDEQPLMVGALGVALGAMLGATMPRTQREDRLMGETRDQVMDKAKQSVSEQAQKAKEAAQHKMDEVQEPSVPSSGSGQQSSGSSDAFRYGADGSQSTGAGSRAGEEQNRPSLH